MTARVLDAFGVVEWLDERDVFDFDYWPLELYKLQSAPPPSEFSGHVALVIGGGNQLGCAVTTRLGCEGAHLVLSGGEAEALRQSAAALPEGMVRVADRDPFAAAIAAFGGLDILAVLDPVTAVDLDRIGQIFGRQGTTGAIVGLETGRGTSVDLSPPRRGLVRANLVRVEDAADPSLVAEAIAFLASPRAAATDRTIVVVGDRLE